MERPFESMNLEKVCTYGAYMHVSCAALMHLSGTWLFFPFPGPWLRSLWRQRQRQRQTWRRMVCGCQPSIGKSPTYVIHDCDAISMMQLAYSPAFRASSCNASLRSRSRRFDLAQARTLRPLPPLTSTRVIVIMHPLLKTSDETLY